MGGNEFYRHENRLEKKDSDEFVFDKSVIIVFCNSGGTSCQYTDVECCI